MMIHDESRLVRAQRRVELAQTFAEDARRMVGVLDAQSKIMTAALEKLRRGNASPREIAAQAACMASFAAMMNQAAANLRKSHAGAREDLAELEDLRRLDPDLAATLRAAVTTLGDSCRAVTRCSESLERCLENGARRANRFWQDAAGAMPH
ncbi:hypothetical protein GCM10007036_29140 [Alsobacter metallidurans]|uniref:Uncharacterized protein n=2 Tax=Alsobacter metallidurans TaxID=340221 RepID=A0A917MIY2_9HYPH|nr:hypothetical protein GCM10007036_29140 [Alsobacter metallidurans]